MKCNENDEIDAEFGIDSRYESDQSKKADGLLLMLARLERMKSFSERDIQLARLIQSKLKTAK